MIELEVRPWVKDHATTMESAGALVARVIANGVPLHYEGAVISLRSEVKRADDGEHKGLLLAADIGDFISVTLYGVPPESRGLVKLEDRLWEAPDDRWAKGEIRCNVSRIKVVEPRPQPLVIPCSKEQLDQIRQVEL